ncbi:unnamed protein product [Knipowitschia caucasica]|uniref:T-cell surface glycoprotein CD3 zeta chain n=1 Tax=Knipowitschia caucasica TaxID=637954 RepID=A0AAV2K218_KNICA
MDCIKSALYVIFILLNPTSCYALSATDPMICYILDGVLITYCIIATALFFREKFSHRGLTAEKTEPIGGIYQELGQSKTPDPYEVLQPSRKRQKRRKKSTATPSDSEKGQEPAPGTSSNFPP